MFSSYYLKPFISLLLFCVYASSNPVSADANIQMQRQHYKEAMNALKKGKFSEYHRLEKQLKDYPLHPYLKYQYMKDRLSSITESEANDFLTRYADFPNANDLRQRWLKLMAKQHRWQSYLDNYVSQKDTKLRCLELQARINVGLTQNLLQDIRDQWLAGKSLPAECDPAFELLYNSHFMNDELVWQRIRMVMQEGNVRLANYLGRRLKPELTIWQKHWVNMHQSPSKELSRLSSEDNHYSREIILSGIKRLAKRHVSEVINRWPSIKKNYQFKDDEIAEIERIIALRAVSDEHPDSVKLLDAIPAEYIDKDVFLSRLTIALKNENWSQLLKWLDSVPPDEESIRNPWYYWKAKALIATGHEFEAKQALGQIVNTRDFYGFIAADQLQEKYGINHLATTVRETVRNEFVTIPAVQRAKELLVLDEPYLAKREWQLLIQHLDHEQLQMAALLASEWDWNDRVIVTLGYGKLYDDLELRFPLAFEKELKWYGTKHQLDLSWIYALVRTESAFVETARSGAGALGLMQVMPRTGKMTAKKIGWKHFNSNMLLEAEKNIPIGSAYLKQMLDRFNGNMILATAAYNAGPHRVNTWLPKQGCVEADVWIEQIPFLETRRYVKRVLYYASIYDWRMNQEIVPISNRMSNVYARNAQGNVASTLACKGEVVSLN